jgi:hypothetical protein
MRELCFHLPPPPGPPRRGQEPWQHALEMVTRGGKSATGSQSSNPDVEKVPIVIDCSECRRARARNGVAMCNRRETETTFPLKLATPPNTVGGGAGLGDRREDSGSLSGGPFRFPVWLPTRSPQIVV